MRIAIVGASGRTGKELVACCLAAGHDVVAIARDPAKVAVPHPRLTVRRADATDAARLAEGLAGAETVLSAIGPVKGGPPAVMTRAADALIAAMKKAGVRRLVWLTGAGVQHQDDAPSGSRRVVRALMKILAPRMLADSETAFAAIVGSDLDWTVVRVPMLRDGPPVGALTAGMNPPRPRPVARADVAAFMLAQVSSSAWVRRAPLVSA